jgi:hypothetical protein
MKKGLITASMVLMALSVFGLVESSRLERTMKMGIGIGFLPFSMSLAMGVLSLVLLVGVLRGKIKIADEPICEKGGALRVVTVVVILSAYIILIEGIGFMPSTFLFFCGTIFILGQRRIVKTLLTSAAFTLFLYAVFRLWLKSPLPTGFLGI